MATNFDRPTYAGDHASDPDRTETRPIEPDEGRGLDGGAAEFDGVDDETPRRDIEAACRSFEADERAAAERTASGDRRHERTAETGHTAGQDWNAVGLVTSVGATCLFGVGGVLARSTQLTAVASVTFVAIGVLLARRGRRWRN